MDRAITAIGAVPADRLLVVGICGAQGSGKSTLAAALAGRLIAHGLPTAVLSLDDLYKTRAERQAMARTDHPLFATRGVPGTHDIALGLATIAALERGEPALLPRFDKGCDDRAPPDRWDRAPAGTRVLLFEGWCVGARPQTEAELASPVNALERDEDPDGLWRRTSNTCLAGPYRTLFDRIDRLILLAAPGFDVVLRWRIEQEQPLRRAGLGMDDATIARFIRHYERLTRHILTEMPERADLTLQLDAQRRTIG